MKKYIQSLAALFALSVGMVSCISDLDTTTVSYPKEGLPYGVYANINPIDSLSYLTVVSEDSLGKPMICYVAKSLKKKGAPAPIYYFVSTSANYDNRIGMITATAPTTYFGDGTNATDSLSGTGYFALKNDKKSYTSQLVTKDGKKVISVISEPVKVFPELTTTWVSRKAEGLIAEFKANDSCAVSFDGKVANGAYTVKDGVVTITYTAATTAPTTAKFNNKMQLVFTVNGKDVVVYPSATPAEPEQFEQLGNGKLSIPAFGDPMNALLFQGNKGTMVISPFVQNQDGLLFRVTKKSIPEGRVITFEKTSTKAKHPKYGEIFMEPQSGVSSYSPKSGQYVFKAEIVVSAGSFGPSDVTYKLDAPAAAPTKVSYTFVKKVLEYKTKGGVKLQGVELKK